MTRRSFSEFSSQDLIIALTMLLIIAGVLFATNRSTDYRSKAYVQSSTGVRIEAEEMIRSAGVTLDASGTFIRFE